MNRTDDGAGLLDFLQAPHRPVRSARLTGKSVLVFGGGSSGTMLSNGQAAAIAYAVAGAHVTVVDMQIERAHATVRLIEGEGGRAVAVQGDVSCGTDIERAVRLCHQNSGRIDVLHNNVGVTEVVPTEQMSLRGWERAFAVNVTGSFLAIKAALPIMRQQGSGVITSISSVAAIRYPQIRYSAYASSKAALNQLIASVALEYARDGIRANAILPGMLNTSMVANQLGDHYSDHQSAQLERAAKCPMGFMGDAWDVANAAIFLASFEARYITGQMLVVDGGLSVVCG